MSFHLKAPQMFMDWLLPVGQQKFPLPQVATIISADDGSAPVSAKAIRNALQEGRLFGNRIPLGSKVSETERIRLQWMTRVDVLQALLVTRTSPPETQIAQVAEIIERFPAEAQDELLRRLVAARARRPIAGGLFASR